MSGYDMNALVSEITREVLAVLGRNPAANVAGRGAVLVILPQPLSVELLEVLNRLAGKAGEMWVAVAPGAKFEAPPGKTSFVQSLEQALKEKLFTRAGFILAPRLSFQDLSMLSARRARNFPLDLITAAWEQGIPVYALREGIVLDPSSAHGAGVLLKNLEDRGLKLLSLEDVKGIGSCAVSPCQALISECNACGHCAVKIEDKVDRIVRSGACRIGGTLGMPPVRNDLASFIDHTLLKPEATREDVLKLCAEAREYGFASVCVNPSWVPLAREQLKGSPVKVCTVVGFPLGATTTITKVIETRDAIANGADEIDMVINVGALKAGQEDRVLNDIREVRKASEGKILKVILETALLSDEEKVRACLLAKQAGADFVKTSTGFSSGGATVHDVALMRKAVGEEMGVKASGGIRDYETAMKMVEAGATRIGASASVAIVKKMAAGSAKY